MNITFLLLSFLVLAKGLPKPKMPSLDLIQDVFGSSTDETYKEITDSSRNIQETTMDITLVTGTSEHFVDNVPNDYVKPESKNLSETVSVEVLTDNEDCASYTETLGYMCVPYYQCSNGTIITDGTGLIDIRNGFGALNAQDGKCPSFLDVCCKDPDFIPPPPQPQAYQASCGRRNKNGLGARIQGFSEGESQVGEWPHMCALLREEIMSESYEGGEIKSTTLSHYVCGASLIEPGVVLTGAHCVNKFNNNETLKVRCGEWDTQSETEAYPHQDRYVDNFVVHPLFNEQNLFNDYAILFTIDDFIMDHNVDTICLPQPGETFVSEDCFATGWGKNKFGHEGEYQVILKEIGLPIIDRPQCETSLRKTRLGEKFRLDDSFLCAGGIPGKDTCKGDGGSPLVCPSKTIPNRYVQAGIVAWGIGCGEKGTPGVYGDVAKGVCFIDHAISCNRVEVGGIADSFLGFTNQQCGKWFQKSLPDNLPEGAKDGAALQFLRTQCTVNYLEHFSVDDYSNETLTNNDVSDNNAQINQEEGSGNFSNYTPSKKEQNDNEVYKDDENNQEGINSGVYNNHQVNQEHTNTDVQIIQPQVSNIIHNNTEINQAKNNGNVNSDDEKIQAQTDGYVFNNTKVNQQYTSTEVYYAYQIDQTQASTDAYNNGQTNEAQTNSNIYSDATTNKVNANLNFDKENNNYADNKDQINLAETSSDVYYNDGQLKEAQSTTDTYSDTQSNEGRTTTDVYIDGQLKEAQTILDVYNNGQLKEAETTTDVYNDSPVKEAQTILSVYNDGQLKEIEMTTDDNSDFQPDKEQTSSDVNSDIPLDEAQTTTDVYSDVQPDEAQTTTDVYDIYISQPQPNNDVYNHDQSKRAQNNSMPSTSSTEYFVDNVPNDYVEPENENLSETVSVEVLTDNEDCASYTETLGYMCVPYYQCSNGTIITDGTGLIDIRHGFGALNAQDGKCPGFLDVCCKDPDFIAPPPQPQPYKASCGKRNKNGLGVRIQGFEEGESQVGEWPHMCALLREEIVSEKVSNGYQGGENNSTIITNFVCGASLVKPGVVLTGAHCVNKFNNNEILKVRCGEWDTQSESEAYPHQDRYVNNFVVHPLFNEQNLFNDYAILFTTDDFIMDHNVDTVCLPQPGETFVSEDCFATGWGKDKFGQEGEYQVILKEIGLPIVDRPQCETSLRKTRLGEKFRLDDSFLCAGGVQGKDTCKGDGGSPLVCPSKTIPNRYVQAGIVAWGIGCGEQGTPGVYGEVAKGVCFMDHVISCNGKVEGDSANSVLGFSHEQCGKWFQDMLPDNLPDKVKEGAAQQYLSSQCTVIYVENEHSSFGEQFYRQHEDSYEALTNHSESSKHFSNDSKAY